MDEQWIAELMIQYIGSPIWQQHIENYKDSFCVHFDPQMHSDPQQLNKIHQDFKQLINLLIVDLSVQTQIKQSKLMQFPRSNIKIPDKTFEDFKFGSSYDEFSQMMKQRSKNIEQEASSKKTSTSNYSTNQIYKDQFKDSEWYEQERLRKQALMLELEDDELRKAMKLSQEDYEAYLRRLQQMEDDELQRALLLSMDYMSKQKQSDFSSIISYSSRVEAREEGASQDELRFSAQQKPYAPANQSIDIMRSDIMAQREEILKRKRDQRELESSQYKQSNPNLFKSTQGTKVEVQQQEKTNQNSYQSNFNPYQSVTQNDQVQHTTKQGSVILDNEAVRKRNSILAKLKSQAQQKDQ